MFKNNNNLTNSNLTVHLEHRNSSYRFQKQKIKGLLSDTKAAITLANKLKEKLSIEKSQLNVAIHWAQENLAHLPNGTKLKRKKIKNNETYWTHILRNNQDITPDCIKHLEHSLIKMDNRWLPIVNGATIVHNFNTNDGLSIEDDRGERIIRLQVDPITKKIHTLKVIKTLASRIEKEDDFTTEAEKINRIRQHTVAQSASRRTTVAQENDVDVQYLTEPFLGFDLLNILSDDTIQEWQWNEILVQCFETVNRICEQGYVHMDIKLDNIVIEFDDRRFPRVHIIDYGFMTHLQNPEEDAIYRIAGTPSYWFMDYQIQANHPNYPKETEGHPFYFNYYTDIYACALIAKKINININSDLMTIATDILKLNESSNRQVTPYNKINQNNYVGKLKPTSDLVIDRKTIQARILSVRNQLPINNNCEPVIPQETNDLTINNIDAMLLAEKLKQVVNNYRIHHERANACWVFFCGRTKNKDDQAIKTLESVLSLPNNDLKTIKNCLKQCSLTSNTEHSFVRYLAKYPDLWQVQDELNPLNLPAPAKKETLESWHRTDAKNNAEEILNSLATLGITDENELTPMKKHFLTQINAYARYIKYHHIFHDAGLKRAEKLATDITHASNVKSIHLAIYNAMHGDNGYESYGFFGSQGVGNHSLSSYLYESVKQYHSEFSLDFNNNTPDNIHNDSERETRRIIRNISAPAA